MASGKGKLAPGFDAEMIVKNMFTNQDRNGDGKVTAEEFKLKDQEAQVTQGTPNQRCPLKLRSGSSQKKLLKMLIVLLSLFKDAACLQKSYRRTWRTVLGK